MCLKCLTIKHKKKKNDDYFFKILANFVPAAAVKREGLALFGLIGRKGYVGGKLVKKNNIIITLNYFF